jgi:sulfatase modifying factor 1
MEFRLLDREAETPTMPSCCAPVRPFAHDAGTGRPTPAPAALASRRGMQHLPGGAFLMGTDRGGFPADGEGPVREVILSPFWIDTCAVTNHQFEKFVKATGYKTDAERFGWSFVFHLLVPPEVASKIKRKVDGLSWWWKVPGAFWRHPEGRGTNIRDRMDHPVVHISWNDAAAYAAWAGKRLPTEAEYEYAARGGLEQKLYPWGDELTPEGQHRCNIWQGVFPTHNTAEDGFVGTAPARSYLPNGFGLFNTAGNVWEWCADWFSADFHRTGPRRDPQGPPQGTHRVMRGGSYLCHESYCNRYRVAARTSNTPDSSSGNIGFRCVADA